MAITIKTRRIAAGSCEVDAPSGTYRLENCPTDQSDFRTAGLPAGPRWMLTYPGEYSADAEFRTKRDAIESIRANEQWKADQASKTTEGTLVTMTVGFKPGQRITVANGTTQTVVKMADRIGNEPQRVEVEGGLQWLASECEPAPRFVVHQLGFRQFAVRDTRTELDAACSTSRSGAQHIADCLADGTMVLDQLGRATVPQPQPQVTDERPACSHGIRLQPGVVLSYAKCEDGTQWGVFGNEGSLEVYDCAVQAANRAAEFRAEDPDTEYGVWQVCKEHPDERYGACTECGDFI